MDAKSFKDYYPDAKSKIFIADQIIDEKKRNKEFFEMAKSLEQYMNAFKTAEDWNRFGIIQKLLTAETLNYPVSFLSFAPSAKHCGNLEEYAAGITENRISLAFERAIKLKEAATSPQPNYLDRHRLIERAVRLILSLLDDKNQWIHGNTPKSSQDAYAFIAECYLLRSRLILPKGSAIPERKLEALNNAWKWTENLSENHKLLKSGIILEKVRWDKNFTDREAFEYFDLFLRKNNLLTESDITYWEINDAYQILAPRFRKTKTKKLEKKLEQYDQKVLKAKDRKNSSPLYKARAAIRRGKDDIAGYLKRAVSKLQIGDRTLPLVSPLWDDTVETIDMVAGDSDKKGQWENSAITAWKICMKAEEKLKNSFHVRWYWARQTDLYNLAFQAALNKAESDDSFYITAAEIADSHKSRPSMKLLDIERNIKNDEEREKLQEILDYDFRDFLDTFIIGINEPGNKGGRIAKNSENQRMFTHVPRGWAAVHFYVTNQYKAHAVILKENFKSAVALEISNLWQAFAKWENARQGFGIDDRVEPYLKHLCEETGRILQPVLEKTQDSNLLLIPHGFLHLVPFHAAILQNQIEKNEKKKKTWWDKLRKSRGNSLKQISCMYLPSWMLAPGKENNILTKGRNLFHSNTDGCQELTEHKDNKPFWSNKKLEHVNPDDAVTELNEFAGHIRLYALFCHARGHMNNPYNSRFLLRDNDMTFGDIRGKVPSLKGSHVVLTACETDLVISNIGPADEHLSLASAFLEKEAAEVIGTLFKCNMKMARELMTEIISAIKKQTGTPLCKILNEWQVRLLKDNKIPLYKIVPFRVMGFPAWDEVKK